MTDILPWFVTLFDKKMDLAEIKEALLSSTRRKVLLKYIGLVCIRINVFVSFRKMQLIETDIVTNKILPFFLN